MTNSEQAKAKRKLRVLLDDLKEANGLFIATPNNENWENVQILALAYRQVFEAIQQANTAQSYLENTIVPLIER